MLVIDGVVEWEEGWLTTVVRATTDEFTNENDQK